MEFRIWIDENIFSNLKKLQKFIFQSIDFVEKLDSGLESLNSFPYEKQDKDNNLFI